MITCIERRETFAGGGRNALPQGASWLLPCDSKSAVLMILINDC